MMAEEELQAILDGIAEETTHMGPWQIQIQRGPDTEWFLVVTLADTREAVRQAWKLASLSSQATTIQVKASNGAYVAQEFIGFGSY
jgi:hypothetical protein